MICVHKECIRNIDWMIWVDKYIATWVNDTDEDNNAAAAAADDDDGDDDV